MPQLSHVWGCLVVGLRAWQAGHCVAIHVMTTCHHHHSGQFDSCYGLSDSDPAPCGAELASCFQLQCLSMYAIVYTLSDVRCVCWCLTFKGGAASPRAPGAFRESVCAGMCQTPFVSHPVCMPNMTACICLHRAWGSPLTGRCPLPMRHPHTSTSYLYLHTCHCDRSYHPSCIVAPCGARFCLPACAGASSFDPGTVCVDAMAVHALSLLCFPALTSSRIILRDKFYLWALPHAGLYCGMQTP